MPVNATKLTLEKSSPGVSHETYGDTLAAQNNPLPAIARLFESLQSERIDYCHWKSNAALDRSARGDNDLDLLVHRADAQRFTGLLYRLGFKEARAQPDERLPGVRDFYGYDEAAARLIHVHAHFQLILGHDFTKSYRLPIECSYLGSAAQGELCRVPAPEFEFVVFVLRMILKHFTWDAVLMRHGYLSSSERHELEYLQSRMDLEKACLLLEQDLPFIDGDLFKACIRALQPGCPLWERIRTGHRLQRTLQVCARRPQAVDTALKLWRRVEWPILDRLHLRSSRKRPANGGLMIALVGGDGSGKTTAVNRLRQSLSDEFEVIQVHMGKPTWSWTTVLVRGLLKIGRSLGLYPFVKEGTEPSLDTTSPEFPGYPWLIREVCTARDRYLDYRRARRFAINGGLVVCDRFPLPGIKIMDGAQVERVTTGLRRTRFLELLARVEHHYYRQISLPDLLIVLRVHPEICARRKTDEPSESVRSRSEEIWNLDWCGTPAHVIDASRSKPEVLSDVLKLVWSHL